MNLGARFYEISMGIEEIFSVRKILVYIFYYIGYRYNNLSHLKKNVTNSFFFLTQNAGSIKSKKNNDNLAINIFASEMRTSVIEIQFGNQNINSQVEEKIKKVTANNCHQ